ncbi:hypothetical protein DCBHLPFO_00659 [Mycoplasmopsis arginini]|uniref:Uncharacterized protein n=1 Tax=Mycoplasmopsis arginini TaxID=2094 RepID=A0AA43R1Q4_MYCAR|nr:hypothetical protein [Mycoplasmopsis arginini]
MFNLFLIVVLIDEVKLFNEPVEVSISSNLPSCSKLSTKIVVTLEDILELNSLNPVVPVILTCIEPEITPSVFNLSLIVVLIEDVNEFKEPVEVSTLSNLPSKSLVVVATEDDNSPIDDEILELKVE